MIGWILDLIFSNLWFVIILFWVFRFFSKGSKEGSGKAARSRQSPPHKPRNIGWETDLEEIRDSATPAKPVEIMLEKKTASSSIPLEKKVEKSTGEPEAVPTPVQGMIWSQIYGPPRSKQAYQTRKTR